MSKQKNGPAPGEAGLHNAKAKTDQPQDSTGAADRKPQAPHVRIDNADLLKLFRIPRTAMALWLYHKMRQGKNPASWPSLDLICEELQMNPKTVSTSRKWLIDNGWLKKVGGRAGAGRFRVPMFDALIPSITVTQELGCGP